MRILVIDGQGGSIGRQLCKEIREKYPDVPIRAVGTNSAAAANMLKGGADQAATGENAVIVGCRWADVIVGTIGIVLADALLGEVTPAMAAAVGSSSAKRILVPLNRCDTWVAGVQNVSAADLLEDVLNKIGKIAQSL